MSVREAIMSSPRHHPNPALMNAAPRARRRAGARTAGDSARRSGRKGDDAEPQFEGDLAMLELRHRLSLDPEAVPVPPQRDRGIPIGLIMLRMCAVACVAAGMAWVLSLHILPAPPPLVANSTGDPPAAAAAAPTLAAKPVKLVQLTNPAEERPALATTLASADDSVAPAQNASPAPQQVDTVAVTPPMPTPTAEPTAMAAAPALGQDEIAALLARGKSFLLNGDIASARLLLQRAAEAGSAEAALTLGSTFDPRVIERLGAVGVTGDPKQAREWYEKAAQLGSPAAPRQLSLLAGRDR
jgi:Sel1 repeat